MKKLFAVLICLMLCFTLAACSGSNDNPPANNSTNNQETPSESGSGTGSGSGTSNPITVTCTESGEAHIVTMSDLPESDADLAAFDITNEYEAGAAVICMLARFEEDFGSAFEMMDTLMGPETPSEFDKSFINNQFDQYPYVMRSYFEGATVDNNYTPTAYSLAFTENPYSRDEAGYVKLYLQSAGADSLRGFTLRQKESTGEWFLWSDSYKGMTAGIRVPAEKDPWK